MRSAPLRRGAQDSPDFSLFLPARTRPLEAPNQSTARCFWIVR